VERPADCQLHEDAEAAALRVALRAEVAEDVWVAQPLHDLDLRLQLPQHARLLPRRLLALTDSLATLAPAPPPTRSAQAAAAVLVVVDVELLHSQDLPGV
jgi:hypothetical protein